MNRSSDTPDRSVLLKELEALSLRLELEEAEMIASMPNTAIEQELSALTLNSAISVDRGQVQELESRNETTARDTLIIGGHITDVSLSDQPAASHKRLKAGRSGDYISALVRMAIRFFQFLSKTDFDVIYDPSCTRLTRTSRTSLGVAVFLAGVTAFLSGTYALSTVFGSYAWGTFAALTLGFMYGCIFLLIGREMVGSQSKRAVLVRVPLAIGMCFIVAIPLEMKFLDGNIDKELRVMNVKENEAALKPTRDRQEELERGTRELQDAVSHYRDEVSYWEKAAEAETVGRVRAGRTGKAGAGPAYREAMRNREASAVALARHEMELKRHAELAEVERKRIYADYNMASIPQTEDFLARYEALAQLKSTSAAAAVVSWGLRGLFMLIGLLPILLKLSLPFNEYDALVESRLRLLIKRIYLLGDRQPEELSRAPSMSVRAEESVADV